MRRVSLVVMGVVALALAGCTSLPFPLPLPIPPGAVSSPLTAPELGDCLDDVNGLDADWRSAVPCTEPHLYDVAAVAEWPHMADFVAELGAAEVFDLIVAYEPGPVVDAYSAWADEYCSTAIREAVGWSELAPQFDDFWVMPSGPWGVDRSLATRADFVGGEHRTLCALGWAEPTPLPSGVTLTGMFDPAFPVELRDCWVETSVEVLFAYCDTPHTDQTLLSYDIAAAFGTDFVQATETMSEDDWVATADLCSELLLQVAPGFDPETMYAWTGPDGSPVWTDLEDAPAADGSRYFVTCGIAKADGSSFTGDAFTGPVESSAAAPEGGNA